MLEGCYLMGQHTSKAKTDRRMGLWRKTALSKDSLTS